MKSKYIMKARRHKHYNRTPDNPLRASIPNGIQKPKRSDYFMIHFEKIFGMSDLVGFIRGQNGLCPIRFWDSLSAARKILINPSEGAILESF